MVVIAVIALMVGLLAPALWGVGVSSRRGACQSNMRQMGLAAQNYLALWDAYPAALRYELKNGQLRSVSWEWVTTMGGQVLGPGPLWGDGARNDQVHTCPECHEASTSGTEQFTGYNYNTSFIGGEAAFPTTGWPAVVVRVPAHACRRTDRSAMFGDGGWKGGANRFMRAPCNSEGLPWAAIYSGTQAFRHGGETNVTWLDGHVSSVAHAFKGRSARDELLDQFAGWPHNGFLSDDDSAYDPR